MKKGKGEETDNFGLFGFFTSNKNIPKFYERKHPLKG